MKDRSDFKSMLIGGVAILTVGLFYIGLNTSFNFEYSLLNVSISGGLSKFLLVKTLNTPISRTEY